MNWKQKLMLKMMSSKLVIKIFSNPIVVKVITLEMKLFISIASLFKRNKAEA